MESHDIPDLPEDEATTAPTTWGRRRFLGVAAGSAAALLAGCTNGGDSDDDSTTEATAAGADGDEVAEAAQAGDLPTVEWTMPTSWPGSLDVLSGGAGRVAQTVSDMTGGRFTINMRTAGEEVPPLEILQNVQSGAVESGHTASYYYTNFGPTMAFGTAMPFGLTYRQQNSWLYRAGGLEMLREHYADQFNTIQFPAGNTGTQMGGWFNVEVASLADLQGLRMRIPGLGAEVMSRLGATPQTLAAGEIFQALQTGAIDATEWVGPSDDLNLEFNTVSDFSYFPGWWEPSATLEMQINLDAYNALPEEYQAVLEIATREANMDMMADYDEKNSAAMAQLLESGDVEVLPFPDDIMAAAEEEAFTIYDEFAADDQTFADIFESWSAFRDRVQQWHHLGELRMLGWGSA